MPKPEKICAHCLKSLPISSFRVFKACGYIRGVCRTCEIANERIRRRKLREAFTGPSNGLPRSCNKCCREKPADAFAIDRNRSSGRRSICRICARYESLKGSAARRGIVTELDKKQAVSLMLGSCVYCGTVGTEESPVGIDRIDNTAGYVLWNVVPCCAICNGMKSSLSFADFRSQVARIAEHLTCMSQSAENGGK